MAAPDWKNNGAAVSGTNAVSPAFAADISAGDIAILTVETANEPIATPSGWSELDAAGNTMIAQTGTAGAATAIAMQFFWKRCAGTEGGTTVSLPDAGNHTLARIAAISGCVSSGNPIKHFTSSTSAASTSYSAPGFTSSWSDIFVLAFLGRGNDSSSTAAFTDIANASLTSVTERNEAGTTSGVGGGWVVITGQKTTAGPVDATTATGPSATQANLQIALISDTSVLAGVARRLAARYSWFFT